MGGLNRRQAMGVLGGAVVAGCTTGPSVFSGAPQIYFLSQSKVRRLDPAGGAPVTLVDQAPTDGTRRAGFNDGIAVHSRTRHIYWSNMGRPDQRDGYIQRCEADGSGVATVVAPGGAFTPKQIKLDETAGHIYWADREGMALMRCNLDGSGVERLLVTGSPEADAGDATRWCVGVALDPTRGHIYWTQKGGDNARQGLIRRMSLKPPPGATPTNRYDAQTLFSGLAEPIDLDLDLVRRQIYWSDRGDNTISRAPMDPPTRYDPQTRLDYQVLVRGLDEAIGVALDLPRKRMVYTSLGGEVGVAGLDGSGARLIATGLGPLTGVCWA